MRRLLVILLASTLMSARGGCGGLSSGGGGTSGGGSSGGGGGGGSSSGIDGGSGGGGNWPTDTDRARVVRAQADVDALAVAVQRVRLDTGSSQAACLTDLIEFSSSTCPSACGNLRHCNVAIPGDLCWGGPYLSHYMVDPWGNDYTATLSNGVVTVMSNGPDGQAGTGDDISAIG